MTIFSNARLADHDLAAFLGSLFKLEHHDIIIVDDEARSQVDRRPRILCEYSLVDGDLCMSLYLSIDPTLPQIGTRQFVRQLCSQFGCTCLMPQPASHPHAANPFLWWLVKQTGEIYQIALKVEELDEDPPRYFIDANYGYTIVDEMTSAEE